MTDRRAFPLRPPIRIDADGPCRALVRIAGGTLPGTIPAPDACPQ